MTRTYLTNGHSTHALKKRAPVRKKGEVTPKHKKRASACHMNTRSGEGDDADDLEDFLVVKKE